MEGDLLAVEKDSALPDVCVKCGSDKIAERRNQQFVYTPPWVFILVVISWLIGLIVMLIVQKRGRLHLPLCAECAAQWRKGMKVMLLGIGWLILGLVIGFAALAADAPALGLLLIVSGFVALIATAVMNNKRFLRARRVDARMIYLAQVNSTAAQAILASSHGPR